MNTDAAVIPRVTGPPGLSSRASVSSLIARAVPLLLVLAVQTCLTYRLIRVSSASGDESLYIYSGHQLIYELLHGGGSPYYETWLSGSPVLYPVLAALIDHIGGLILVREFSMLCTFGATVLLHLTAKRMFGYWVGITAALLFALLGITHGLGVLATYDALSLFIIAAASYAAVRASDSTKWLVLVPVLLLLANAVKYASVLFDPVVIGLAALQLRDQGWRRVAQRTIALSIAVLISLATAIFLAGSAYWHGILFTTLTRPTGNGALHGWSVNSPAQVFSLSWAIIGFIVIAGAAALIVAIMLERQFSLLLLLSLLALAGTLVTIEGMRYHTVTSVTKHDDFGVWFTCIAAGYALARATELMRLWYLKSLAVFAAISLAVCIGWHYVTLTHDGSDQVSHVPASYAALRPYLNNGQHEYLLGGLAANQIIYDDHLSGHWWQFIVDTYIKYPIPGRGGDWDGRYQGLSCGGPGQPTASAPGCVYLKGTPGFQAAIRNHAFALVSMLGTHQVGAGASILATVKSTPGYVLLTTAGGAPTYIYAPDYPGKVR